MRVDVKPKLLRWARERVGLGVHDLSQKFPRLQEWESESAKPTLKQLEKFANATHTPVGCLFLSEPPVERIPIPDLRTVADRQIQHPSPDLLETIYICQERQDWYRDFARSRNEKPLRFVGSVSLTSEIETTAAAMRDALGFDIEERRQMRTWTEALKSFIDKADKIGILVMVNGVVGNNTHRKLDSEEFRGFALSDDLAPLVFINAADSKAAQMFTLAHELAHIWLGESALSDPDRTHVTANRTESWCNSLAAETLVPRRQFEEQLDEDEDLQSALSRLAHHFKVSTLVVLRRFKDAGRLSNEQFWDAYDAELGRLRSVVRTGSGGDFYLTEGVRVGKRFARALVTSTLEGTTLYRDAMRLLGISKVSTFNEFGHSIGVA